MQIEHLVVPNVNGPNNIPNQVVSADPSSPESKQEKELREILFDPSIKSNLLKNKTDREKDILIQKIMKTINK